MAKCIQNPRTKEAKRLSDEEADKLHKQGWIYISKTQFKRLMEKAQAA